MALSSSELCLTARRKGVSSSSPAPAALGSVEVPEVDAEVVAVAEGVAVQPAGLQLQPRPSLVFKSNMKISGLDFLNDSTGISHWNSFTIQYNSDNTDASYRK